MRNANPRDGELGRSWGKWAHEHFDKAKQERVKIHYLGFNRFLKVSE